ncbi:hypothetical protein [Candidatus Gromoviella agglomerans]|uniref:hypothetical protein n=1 Tax=Candidatus Gromoviella agglomerans TaxID=2806609 RepID=UPI001E4A415C|nr:hypothetical protein [Candidatus Gromoviella agglomerans]UFX98251.1 hypothetical protein Gromo_00134 [Candidatus Gromoviella agglomerans]
MNVFLRNFLCLSVCFGVGSVSVLAAPPIPCSNPPQPQELCSIIEKPVWYMPVTNYKAHFPDGTRTGKVPYDYRDPLCFVDILRQLGHVPNNWSVQPEQVYQQPEQRAQFEWQPQASKYKQQKRYVQPVDVQLPNQNIELSGPFHSCVDSDGYGMMCCPSSYTPPRIYSLPVAETNPFDLLKIAQNSKDHVQFFEKMNAYYNGLKNGKRFLGAYLGQVTFANSTTLLTPSILVCAGKYIMPVNIHVGYNINGSPCYDSFYVYLDKSDEPLYYEWLSRWVDIQNASEQQFGHLKLHELEALPLTCYFMIAYGVKQQQPTVEYSSGIIKPQIVNNIRNFFAKQELGNVNERQIKQPFKYQTQANAQAGNDGSSGYKVQQTQQHSQQNRGHPPASPSAQQLSSQNRQSSLPYVSYEHQQKSSYVQPGQAQYVSSNKEEAECIRILVDCLGSWEKDFKNCKRMDLKKRNENLGRIGRDIGYVFHVAPVKFQERIKQLLIDIEQGQQAGQQQQDRQNQLRAQRQNQKNQVRAPQFNAENGHEMQEIRRRWSIS